LLEVEVVEVTYSSSLGNYVVILREKSAESWFPIFVGPGEAQAIAVNLRGQVFPRPMTFDLLSQMLEHLDGKVRSVSIVRQQDHVYFAEIELLRPDMELIRLDARPSDAIPLALRLGVPIWVEEKLFRACAQSGLPQVLTDAERLEDLELALKDCIEREDYENAARIRDEIMHLQESQEQQEKPERHD
jgi:uncharacterized protein